MKRNVILWAGMLYFAVQGSGFAATYNFNCIPPPLLQQNCDDGAAQTFVEVTQPGGGQVLFTFHNVGSIPMKIASVYFDDMNGVLQGPMTIIQAGPPIVQFAQDSPPDNPPRGANLVPPFGSEFSASKVNGNDYAVDPGETVGIRFAIASGKTFSNVLNDLGSGVLRIAEHVISFAATNGSSEAFVNQLKTTDLSITKTASPDPVQEGGSLTYTITVTNNGPDTADNVTVTDTLPGTVSFVSATPSQGSCSGTSTVTCNLGSLANGASATVTIVVTPTSAGTLSNTASVSSSTSDPNTGNNSSSTTTTVNPASSITDIEVTQTVSPNPVDVGLQATFTITVTNNGPDTATGVTLTDTMPSNVTFNTSAVPPDSLSTTQGTCTTPSGGVFTCSIGTLLNGASATITLVVTTTTAGMIGNTASVACNESESTTVNNSAAVTTNVGDVSRLINISTRALVGTLDNREIAGFILGGNVSKQLLIRGRGPSMSGAPDFVSGTLANPYIRIYSVSAGAYIAQNDAWGDQSDPLCASSGYVCGTPAEITATGMDPCVPNPGQSVAPAGCADESALLITLPPGGYTVVMSGVSNGIGVGLIEVFDVDGTTLPKLVNISTRAQVGTLDNRMIGGFIIGAGTGDKQVLIRARGPSMSGAPDFVSGTLANPYVRLYSFAAGAYIAQNDNWGNQSDPLCASSGYVCGTPAEITATGMDPCVPNPGQSTEPVGCANEAALLITLPPGGYTAVVSGASNGTGVGLVEIFETSP